MMLFAMGTIIYIASGSPLKKVSILLPSLMVLGVVLMLLSPYRRARLMTLLNHGGDSQDNASGYHMEQVSIALGSGGFFGVGFGQSKQKYAYLPEIASDSIFAVIGEEFGFVGTTVVILAFAYLIYKGLMIARNAPDLLGRLLAVGVTSWIGLQVLINITAMAGLIPLTGVPLPLISYGGSSMLFTMMGIGVLANVAKNS
jgi:cell division protein FtsW